MGGQIGATSELGSGSTFWFELELASARGESARVQPAGKRLVDAPASLILVAEDNPINQVLVLRMLEKLGHHVELARDGREAVAKTAAGHYDAVLMDCQMPELDGYAASRAIRRREGRTGHVPIIAMTAHSLAGDREKCLAAGMDDYISKPMRLADLATTLARNLPAAPAALAS